MGNGLKPGGSADKSLGEIVSDVTSKLQLLVREEIELAKAEIADKAAKLGKGAGFVVGALITLLFFAIFLFHGLSWVINDLLDAEEVFVTNSNMGLMPVCRVERKAIGQDKPGPVTRRLMEAYAKLVESPRGGRE